MNEELKNLVSKKVGRGENPCQNCQADPQGAESPCFECNYSKIVDFCEKYNPTFSEILPSVYACATSNHEDTPERAFELSNGAKIPNQAKSLVDVLNVKRKTETVYAVCGLAVNRQKFYLLPETVECLSCLSCLFDIVIVPLILLEALKQEGLRDRFPNCVAFNSIPSTMRNPPSQKIVDINNWSY